MNIAIDVDGVLADFSGAFSRVLHDLYGLDVTPEPKQWLWSDWVDGLTHEMEAGAWRAIREDPAYRYFWNEMYGLCESDAIARINRLSRDNLVSFITCRSAEGQHENIVTVTRNWLRKHGLFAADNVFRAGPGKKGLVARSLGVHLVLDDNGENCLDCLDAGVGVAMLRRPYNESFVKLVEARGGHIVNSVSAFLDVCERLDASDPR